MGVVLVRARSIMIKHLMLTENSINDYKAELDIYLTNSLLLLGNIHDFKGNRSRSEKCL